MAVYINKKAMLAAVSQAAKDDWRVALQWNYSGRGMYGNVTLAVVCEGFGEWAAFMQYYVAEALKIDNEDLLEDMHPDDVQMFVSDNNELFREVRTDNLGDMKLFYWSKAEFIED